MRHPLTSWFSFLGLLALALAAFFPMWQQINKYSHEMHPNGYMIDERREYPFAVTGAGFAVMSGLCFLAAAVVNSRPCPEGDHADPVG